MRKKLSTPTFIVVTGGVLSGLGKGVASASIGKLLNFGGLKVVPIKCEGYLNLDSGTMNPIEHGEVFVLEDGEEADMDFGHYERMLDITCRKDWNITMGKVYQKVFEKERRGDYLGKNVQLIPHVTDEILRRWKKIGKINNADVVMIEIGGTVGDIENELYLEAAHQLRRNEKYKTLFVHLTYVPIPDNVGEQKTKPTQQSVQILRQKGLIPDIMIVRCPEQITEKTKEKIAQFCDVPMHRIISGHDVATVYEIPLLYAKQNTTDFLRKHIHIPKRINIHSWQRLVNSILHPKQEIKIGLCGKYTELEDSYASVVEALVHAGAHHSTNIVIDWIDTQHCERDKEWCEKRLHHLDGIIIPGGFGKRGVEGKILIIEIARKQDIPLLGICYGLQLAVIEFARNVCNLKGAHTTEVNPTTEHPIVTILNDQKDVTDKGGTMRRGAYPAKLDHNSLAYQLYKKELIYERHRHRYEVNPEYHKTLERKGMEISGLSPNGTLAEFIELPDHPYFIATQAHPELLSKLEKPSPLFEGLVKAALRRKTNR